MKYITTLALAAFLTPAFATIVVGFNKDYPTQDVVKQTMNEKTFQRALEAYRYWYPTVSMEGIMNGIRELGIKDNESLFVTQGQSNQLAFTANIDTAYAGGTLDLSKGPFVIEIPAGKFMGLVNDHHQNWVVDMGLPGQDKGKGGKYLIVPPGFKSATPSDLIIAQASTNKISVVFRAITEDGSMDSGFNMLSNIKVYPYDSKDTAPLKIVNISGKKADFTLLKWEDNLEFWNRLHKVISEEPINENLAPMYGLLSSLGIEKGKKFDPDKQTTGLLTKAAEEGKKQMLVTAYAQMNRPDRLAWKDRKWEWLTLVPDSGNFTNQKGQDLDARERYFSQAIVMSPAMTKRTEGAGSLYWGIYQSNKGNFLEGDKTYKMTIPLPVPAGLFWSVTLYDAEFRSLIINGEKAGLRSLVELKDLKNKKSVDIFFGPKVPVGKENFWVKTNPGKGWFAYFRIYGPDKDAFSGNWKPGDLVQVQTADQTAAFLE